MRDNRRIRVFLSGLLLLAVTAAVLLAKSSDSGDSVALSGDLALRSQRLAYRQLAPLATDGRLNLRLTYLLSSNPGESLWLDVSLPAPLADGEYRLGGDALSMRLRRYRGGRAQTLSFAAVDGVLKLSRRGERLSGVLEFAAIGRSGQENRSDSPTRAEARAVFNGVGLHLAGQGF